MGLYQLPKPIKPVAETPTNPALQTSPVPGVGSVEFSYYNRDRNRITTGPLLFASLFAAPPAIVQSDVTPRTISITSYKQINVEGKALITGTPNQDTSPILPVSNPLFNYYWRDINRLMQPRSVTQLNTIIPALDIPNIFFPGQPLFNYYYRDINRIAEPGPTEQLDGPIPSQIQIFFPQQPEYGYYKRDINRLLDGVGPVPQIDGPTKQQWYIFPNNNPLFNYYVRNVNLILEGLGPVEQLDGVINSQIQIFYPNQPELSRYTALQSPRSIIAAPIRLEGPTSQQTYIFPNGNPAQQNHYFRNVNLILEGIGSTPQVDGASVQQTYVFPLLQPYLAPRRVPVVATYPTDPVSAPVNVPHFPTAISQPDFRRYGQRPPIVVPPLFILQQTVTTSKARSYAYFIG